MNRRKFLSASIAALAGLLVPNVAKPAGKPLRLDGVDLVPVNFKLAMSFWIPRPGGVVDKFEIFDTKEGPRAYFNGKLQKNWPEGEKVE